MDRLPVNSIQPLDLVNNKLIQPQVNHLAPYLVAKALETYTCFLDIPCHQVSHPWNESCLKSAILLFIGSFKRNLNVYGSLYLLSAVLRGRPIKYYFTRLPNEVARSSVFLAANCFYFLGFFCLARKLFGGVSYWGSLLANIPACFLSIILERKQRRGILALYLTNLATETGFNMLVSRKLLPVIPNGEVLLFALTSAAYAILYKMKALDGSISNLIKMFIGNAEAETDNFHVKQDRQSRIIKYYGFTTIYLNNILNIFNNLINGSHHHNHNFFIILLRNFENRLDRFLVSLSKSKKLKHRLCAHRYNCLIYTIMGFIQRFSAGYLLQFAVRCLGSLGGIIKNPKLLIKLFKSPVNTQLGMFLGSYVFIFRLISCLLRWITNKNHIFHAALAGFFSGWSMIYYKSSSIALYLNFKLYEILWMIGVNSKKLPHVKSFDSILYTLSTAFVLWAALYEPHNIRPAYWKFLIKVSDNKFQQVNRFPLDAFGTKSSTIDRIAVITSKKH